MKQGCCLCTAVAVALSSHAQQPKAYRMIRYAARLHDTAFVFSYADGYAPASSVQVRVRGTTMRLEPETGEPTENGAWVFRSAGPTGTAGVVVQRLMPDAPAPLRVSAVYRSGSLQRPMVFTRK